MATVFWDTQGIILIDYLQKTGQTIAGEYDATLLSRLHEKLCERNVRNWRTKKSFLIKTTGLHFRSFDGKSV